MSSTIDTAVPGVRRAPGDPELIVLTPYRAGLPNLRRYLRDSWDRRQFIWELSRTELRAGHYNTVLGQLWLILNPLLLTAVYYLLTGILSHHKGGAMAYLSHLMSGLFAYYFFMQTAVAASGAVTKGSKIIMNTAFPKAMLVFSAVLVGFMRFLPTIIVYMIVHAAGGMSFTFDMLWALVPLAELFVWTFGFSLLVAAMTVYFRDTKSFLPYILRIWLYLSPVLYYGSQYPKKYAPLKIINPLFPMLDSWSESISAGVAPSMKYLMTGAGWAGLILLIGGYVFVSRERDFAVRL